MHKGCVIVTVVTDRGVKRESMTHNHIIVVPIDSCQEFGISEGKNKPKKQNIFCSFVTQPVLWHLHIWFFLCKMENFEKQTVLPVKSVRWQSAVELITGCFFYLSSFCFCFFHLNLKFLQPWIFQTKKMNATKTSGKQKTEGLTVGSLRLLMPQCRLYCHWCGQVRREETADGWALRRRLSQTLTDTPELRCCREGENYKWKTRTQRQAKLGQVLQLATFHCPHLTSVFLERR